MQKRQTYEKFLDQTNVVAAVGAAAHLASHFVTEQPKSDALKQFYANLLKKNKKQVDSLDDENMESSLLASDSILEPNQMDSLSLDYVMNEVPEKLDISLVSNASSQNTGNSDRWGYVTPLLLGAVAGVAIADGGSSSVAAPQNNYECDISFDIPSKPALAGGTLITVARGQTLEQSAGDIHTIENGKNLIVTTAANTLLWQETDLAYQVYASDDIADVYISAGVSSYVELDLVVDGGIGDLAVVFDSDTNGQSNIQVDASDDIESFTYYDSGFNADGTISVDVIGGDIGAIDALSNSLSGGANIYISAYAAVVGSGLVGGNVGDIHAYTEGAVASAWYDVEASGGNIGNITFHTCGGSASAYGHFSAFSQLDGDGNVIGGNIGNITVMASGHSADPNVNVKASGGSIGDIQFIVEGSDTDADLRLRADSLLNISGDYVAGGHIGDVSVHMSGNSGSAELYIDSAFSVGDVSIVSMADNTYSGSAQAYINLYGVSGSLATVGDINLLVSNLDGYENSAGIRITAYDGGAIGDIVAEAIGGASAHLDISAFAQVGLGGVGGTIGDLTLTDTSMGGDHSIRLYADVSMGDIDIATGATSANVRMTLLTGASGATVGDITVNVADDHYGSAGFIDIGFHEGTDVGTINIVGGSELSRFRVYALDDYYEYFISSDISGDVATDVDMSEFLGYSDVDLSAAEGDGVRIDVAQNGSLTQGTSGQDFIYLSTGDDIVDFTSFHSSAESDVIYNFDLESDGLKVIFGGGGYDELTSNQVLSIDTNDVVTLVDIVSGDNIMTESGLLSALNGGEYGLIDSMSGGRFTFATATSSSATSFNLYSVEHNGSSYTTAELMAVVNLDTGLTFAELTSSNIII